jgi:2-polyprenyl-3-methyl-5-hydroxy-6-metoxy-1,4-benzoquinol methylase
VLDIPCGSGRHSLELARRGYRPTGIDIAPGFVAEAEQHAREASLVAWFRIADMRDLDERAAFDAAFCVGNSFGYLQHDDTVRFLQQVALALKPGGRFLMDTGLVAESILPALQPESAFTLGGIELRTHRTYDAATSRVAMVYTFVRDGQEDTRSMTQQVYTAAEIQRMLAGVGLRTLARFSSTAGAPYELGSPYLLLVAQKDSA